MSDDSEIPADDPRLKSDEHPTGALQATDVLTQVWATFRAQGGDKVPPDMSLVGGRTLNPADPDSRTLGPASVSLEGLEEIRLGGDDPQFRDVRLLGEGGMGQVRLAVDRGLRREVALKTTREGAPEREGQALVQEAFFSGYLEHPNLVPVHRLGRSEDGRPVLVMKRVVGTSWLELLKDPDHPRWEDLADDRLRANLGILIRVCDAVRYAHSKGILHRDIKPANVMVGEFGEVYLVDWGAAVRIRDLPDLPPTIVGTLAYMAPEMLEEPSALDQRTDVYLLGATLHHLLTGKPRHSGSGHYELLSKVFHSAPPEFEPGSVPEELAELCAQATHHDPEQRPADALEFRRALEDHLDHRGSILLAQQALTKLEPLRQATAKGHVEREDLFDACRYGFAQALDIWPENVDAREGLQACLELGVEFELQRRNRGLVKSLLRALPEPRPDLEQRLEALEQELAAEATATGELAALRRDHDVGTRSRERALALLFATAGCAVVSLGVYAAVQLFDRKPNFPLFGLAGVLAGVVLLLNLTYFRKALLEHSVNRKLVGVVAAGYACSMLALVTAWFYYGDNYDYYFMDLALVFVTVGAVTSATVDKRLLLPTCIGALACFTQVLFPLADAVLTHVVSGLVIYGVIVWVWYRTPSKG